MTESVDYAAKDQKFVCGTLRKAIIHHENNRVCVLIRAINIQNDFTY